jgi:hypothetical protein
MARLLSRASRPILTTSGTNRVKRMEGRQSISRPERRRINAKGSNQGNASLRGDQQSAAYVYAILVNGVVRYIGKGRNRRLHTHLIEAKRSVDRCAVDTSGLYPRLHRKLVEAIRTRAQFGETIIASGLTDRAACSLESKIIGQFHKFRADQLWNTIDERFMDPRYLPNEWHDPEHPLYKLGRPLAPNRTAMPKDSRDGTAHDQALGKALAALGWNQST